MPGWAHQKRKIRVRTYHGKKGYHNSGPAALHQYKKYISPSQERLYSDKCLNVYKYPHSRSTMKPKFPDGGATQSIGHKEKQHAQVTLSLSKPTYIVFTPGLLSNILIATYTNGVIDDAKTVLKNAQFLRPKVIDVLGEDSYYLPQLEQWRFISAGLKLACTSTKDDNGGAWEAVRIPTSTLLTRPSDWATTEDQYLQEYFISGYYPINLPLTDVSLDDQPSYKTGTLKNLHYKYFQIANIGSDNNWKKPFEFERVELDDSRDNNIRNTYIDEDTHSIVIKISPTADLNTTITLDAEINLELVTHLGSPLAHTMTPAPPKSHKLNWVKQQLRSKLSNAC